MRFLPIVSFGLVMVATLTSAQPTAADGTLTMTCSSHEVSADGKKVTAFFNHPDVGLIVAEKLDVVSPDYSEFTYVNGALKKSESTVVDAHCAYAGSAEGAPLAAVVLFTCGARGARATITFPNSTSLQLRKTADLEVFGGDFVGTIRVETEADSAAMGFNHLHEHDEVESTPAIDIGGLADPVPLDESSSKHRRSLLSSDVAVVYFDYVFVSDDKRYANYGGDADAVKADTLDEVAAVNAMYLIGNKFTPQIQFRVKTQIVWAEKPSQMDATNVGTGSMGTFGESLIPPLGLKMRKEFQQWIFETTYFDFTGYLKSGNVVPGTGAGTGAVIDGARAPFVDFLVSGPAYDAVQGADGWHLLSGESHFDMGDGNSALGFTIPEHVCKGSDNSPEWRGGCEPIIKYFDSQGTLTWNYITTGITGTASCHPNQAAGITSTLNTPVHRFPGMILGHELGHDLGFKHVYTGDDAFKGTEGNVNGCLDDNPHNGSAVMGYTNWDGSISWNNCSVTKFRTVFDGPDFLGNSVEGGKYSCATFSSDALPETYNPGGTHFASGQSDYLHHLSGVPAVVAQSPPPAGVPAVVAQTAVVAQSPPPAGVPAVMTPSPPPFSVPVGSTVVAYTINFPFLTDSQSKVTREAILRNANVLGVN